MNMGFHCVSVASTPSKPQQDHVLEDGSFIMICQVAKLAYPNTTLQQQSNPRKSLEYGKISFKLYSRSVPGLMEMAQRTEALNAEISEKFLLKSIAEAWFYILDTYWQNPTNVL